MYESQWPWYELYSALLEYDGADAYADILELWPAQHSEELEWIAAFRQQTEGDQRTATDDDLCRLYAIFRVTSLLLLRFQSGRADGTDYPGPAVCVEGYQLFHEALGFRVPVMTVFHPFFHEIVRVEQSPEPDTLIEIVDQRWPPLMLGNLMFCRAGSVVCGGTNHVVKDIAENSTLYWTFRRKDRRCNDQSHGWGGNSQWRTRLRRDYQLPTGFHYNIDATESPTDPTVPASLDEATGTVDGLDVAAMIELVRNRCLIKSTIDDSDLYPYCHAYSELPSP